jgi:hypothetical protein
MVSNGGEKISLLLRRTIQPALDRGIEQLAHNFERIRFGELKLTKNQLQILATTAAVTATYIIYAKYWSTNINDAIDVSTILEKSYFFHKTRLPYGPRYILTDTDIRGYGLLMKNF